MRNVHWRTSHSKPKINICDTAERARRTVSKISLESQNSGTGNYWSRCASLRETKAQHYWNRLKMMLDTILSMRDAVFPETHRALCGRIKRCIGFGRMNRMENATCHTERNNKKHKRFAIWAARCRRSTISCLKDPKPTSTVALGILLDRACAGLLRATPKRSEKSASW